VRVREYSEFRENTEKCKKQGKTRGIEGKVRRFILKGYVKREFKINTKKKKFCHPRLLNS